MKKEDSKSSYHGTWTFILILGGCCIGILLIAALGVFFYGKKHQN